MSEFHQDDPRARLAELTGQLSSVVTKVAEKGHARRDELAKAIDAVHDRLDSLDAQGQKAALASPQSKSIEGRGPLLTLEQKAAPHFEQEDGYDFDAKNVRLGALIVGKLHYENVKSQLRPDEIKALSILTDPSGGMLLPSVIGKLWIDAIRPKLQVLNAGALTYAMEALNVLLPGWDTPPKAGWRGHNTVFTDSGGSFREVELNARDVGCFLDIPQILFEDAAANLDAVSTLVETQLGKAVAQAIDLAALTSQDALNASGTATPMGLSAIDSTGHVSANYGINLSNVTGTNGATPTYDNVIDNVQTVLSANFTPTAHLSAPRAFASLAKLKDSQGRYLGRPSYLDGVTDYQTSQVPINLTKGTSSDCTASFIGDFGQMVVGLRSELRILVDPYTQGLGRTTRLVVWQKADIGVLNKTAFQIIDGVRP